MNSIIYFKIFLSIIFISFHSETCPSSSTGKHSLAPQAHTQQKMKVSEGQENK